MTFLNELKVFSIFLFHEAEAAARPKDIHHLQGEAQLDIFKQFRTQWYVCGFLTYCSVVRWCHVMLLNLLQVERLRLVSRNYDKSDCCQKRIKTAYVAEHFGKWENSPFLNFNDLTEIKVAGKDQILCPRAVKFLYICSSRASPIQI